MRLLVSMQTSMEIMFKENQTLKGLPRFLKHVKHWPQVLAMNVEMSTSIFMRNQVENQ